MKNVVTKEELKKHLIDIFYNSSIQIKQWYSFQQDDWSWLWITYKLKSQKNTFETMLPISNIWWKNIIIEHSRWQEIFDDIEYACEKTADKIVNHIFNSINK